VIQIRGPTGVLEEGVVVVLIDGDGSGDSIELGAPLPANWETDRANSHRLYAMWQAR